MRVAHQICHVDRCPAGARPGTVYRLPDLEVASRLGALADFLVVPCNAAHVGLDEMRSAAGCPVLSMIDVVVDETVRRRCRRVGVLGAYGAPPPYVAALNRAAVDVEQIDARLQAPVDAGIRAVMEGRRPKSTPRPRARRWTTYARGRSTRSSSAAPRFPCCWATSVRFRTFSTRRPCSPKPPSGSR